LAEFITGMDTRIGYPTEHLAEKTAEEMSLPMYATGIGLVLRGQQHSNRTNAAKDKNAPTAPSRTKGSFFDSIFKKGKEFFGEEDVN